MAQSALEVWREKLEFLERERAITADAAQKFSLEHGIKEAQWRIEKLESRESSKAGAASPTVSAGSIDGVFISYAHENSKFADKLYKAFQDANIRPYLDRHDFTSGSIEKNIDRFISNNDHVVPILSEHSLASEWVWLEISSTLEKEKALDKDILFPIRLDDSCFENVRNKERLLRYIKERVILDFSKPRSFKENFDKLVTGMKENQ